MTWWEWKHTKKRLYEQGKRDLSEEVLFASLAHQRKIEDAAALASATARRQIARRPGKNTPSREADDGRLRGVNTATVPDADDDLEFWD